MTLTGKLAMAVALSRGAVEDTEVEAECGAASLGGSLGTQRHPLLHRGDAQDDATCRPEPQILHRTVEVDCCFVVSKLVEAVNGAVKSGL